ncbi:NADPH:quinone oxidoreductase family protein [Oceanibacterium hippocampi]|uniref:Alcohol dehydrogenase n=1 Tax=Oceanibacterium hippocampi TaxID=745714 RepID=A0A1Y5U0D9_9PROT|nr:NADPH:quinone oxidoreductase family protein [Oceanibacterium hippocampi]SLN77705.1 Alcohol dehydrogenase [Oceanibacterium hippocampi]
MRAWICEKWGGPRDLVLGDLPKPACPPGSILVRAEAWGVNFADLVLIAGQYQARPAFPFSPGMEVAGIVEEVGTDVRHAAPGDRVAAYVEYGGYAEFVAVPAANAALLPASVPWPDAAAFPVSYGTAALALERGQVSPGETVLVGGAGGAVGSALTELSHRIGAHVIACAGSPEKAAIARDRGADHVVSSRSADLLRTVRDLAPKGIDVAFDPVGGAFFQVAFRALRYAGRLVTLGFASGALPTCPVNHVLVRHIAVLGSSFGLTCHENPGRIAALWPPLVDQFAAGRIRPPVAGVSGFDSLPEALRRLADREVGGKLVLSA